MAFKILIVIVSTYIIGSVPFGVIIGKLWKGIDVRQFGSGNIGSANVLRTLGPIPAAIVLVGDTVKGVIGVLISRWLVPGSPSVDVLAGLGCIAGHNWSAFLKFGGGRGVATSFGVLVGLNWRVALVALLAWTIVVAISRYISLGSVAGGISVPISMWCFARELPYVVFGFAVMIFVIYRHLPNIKRLTAGQEFKIGQKISTNNTLEKEKNKIL